MVEYKQQIFPSMGCGTVQTTTCPAVIYVKDAKSGAKERRFTQPVPAEDIRVPLPRCTPREQKQDAYS